LHFTNKKVRYLYNKKAEEFNVIRLKSGIKRDRLDVCVLERRSMIMQPDKRSKTQ